MKLTNFAPFQFNFKKRNRFSNTSICLDGLLQFVKILLLFHIKFAFTSQRCRNIFDLAANQSVQFLSIQGPSCRIEITAPEDYEIDYNCFIDIPCDTNGLYVTTDDNRNSKSYCGKGSIKGQSHFHTLVLTYTTSGNVGYGSYYNCSAQTIRNRSEPCDCGWSTNTKIVGGTEAKLNEFPFMAGLVSTREYFIFCGGSIISHHFILSAAHCFHNENPEELAVLVGGHNVSAVEAESPYTAIHLVKSIEIHNLYKNDLNDIALVSTVTSMEWSRGVGPICLPFLFEFATFTGMQVEIAGWGTTSYGGKRSDALMKAYVNVTSNADCIYFFPKLNSSQICTYAKDSDSCQYDSGGPVILQYDRMFLVGIVSFGVGCATAIPAVNTRVTSYLNWIQDRTGENFCRKT